MIKRLLYKLLLFTTVFFCSCKKQYNPPATNTNFNYLVVEGIINSGNDSTIIKLSRTVTINNDNSKNPELKAAVAVEDDNGTTFALKELGGGKYGLPALNINSTQQYRLRIKTHDNRQYLSDYAAVQVTPPIDSVGFTVNNEGLLIYVNTHDPTNRVQYYRWDYTEEWIFYAEYQSLYVGVGSYPKPDSIVERNASNQVYQCFKGDSSSEVVINSTAGLKQAMLFHSPIATIPKTSEKVELEYSILINQYALTPDAYKFYDALRNNTQQLGSIFDAQPSEISGNIHCLTNPKEPVIGYVSVNNVTQSQRFYVHRYNQLPADWTATYPYSCELSPAYYTVKAAYNGYNNVNQVIAYLLIQPYQAIAVDKIGTLGYEVTDYECGDCTIRGSRTPPPYWQY